MTAPSWIVLFIWAILISALIFYSVGTLRLTRRMLLNWLKLRDRKEIVEALLPQEYEKYSSAYNRRRIGGREALSKMNLPPEELGRLFTYISDKFSLVYYVLRRNIVVKSVRLNPPEENSRRLTVSLVIQNMTRKKITFRIPKGQIFEDESAGSNTQNLAAARDYEFEIERNSSSGIVIETFCVNKNLAYPAGNKGRITTFKLKNKGYQDQADLWAMIDPKNRQKSRR